MKKLITVALVASLSLLGCNKSSDHSGDQGQKPAPSQPNDQGGNQQPQEQTQPQQQPPPAPRSEIPIQSQRAVPLVEPLPLPATPPAEPIGLRTRITNGFTGAKDYIHGRWEALGTLIHPSDDTTAQRENLNHSRDQEQMVRQQKLDNLRNEILHTNAIPAHDVQTALVPTDEISAMVGELMSVSAPDRIQVVSNRLINEIFDEPDLSRAKVMEVQLGLRHLAEHGLYTSDQSKRVAFLQALLDERIKSDQSAALLRDGLFIAGSSAALGVVAGFRGFEGLHTTVDEYKGVGDSLSRLKNGVEGAISGSGRFVGRGLNAVRTRFTLVKPAELARRNLLAIGLDEDQIGNLELETAETAHVQPHYQNFQATNLQGFRYALVDNWQGTSLGDERVLLLSLPRNRTIQFRVPGTVVSRKLSASEARELEGKLHFVPPDQGGREFVTIVDTQTGDAVTTRIPANELRSEIEGLDAEVGPLQPLDEGGGPGRRSVAEAQAEGDVPLTYTGAESASVEEPATPPADETQAQQVEDEPSSAARQPGGFAAVRGQISGAAHNIAGKAGAAAQGIADKAGAAAQGIAQTSKRVINQTVDTVRPVVKKFDPKWATAVAVGSAVPMYGVYYEGYGLGHDHGQNYESVYLESLIPRESLSQIALMLEP